MATEIRTGVLAFPQYVDWPSLQRIGRRVDELGYDSLWTWDHLYPIQGDWRGPIFEGYMTLAGWAAVTERVTLGLMVGANTFRNPALVVKIVTALDHMSAGRAILGIGGAWFETEHEAYGIDFGSGFGERLDWLDEAVVVMRDMLRTGQATARGPRYRMKKVRNDPPPVQERLPILIGGSGERKTLQTVARYADAWNAGGDIEKVRRKEDVLRRWCDEVGRDHAQIERTYGAGGVVIRDDPKAGRRVAEEMSRRNGNWDGPEHIGNAEEIAAWLRPFVQLGFRHIFFDAPMPHDEETIERFIREVKPILESETSSALG